MNVQRTGGVRFAVSVVETLAPEREAASCLPRLRTWPAITDASRWPPMPSSIMNCPSVHTRPWATRLWTALRIIGRDSETGLEVFPPDAHNPTEIKADSRQSNTALVPPNSLWQDEQAVREKLRIYYPDLDAAV